MAIPSYKGSWEIAGRPKALLNLRDTTTKGRGECILRRPLYKEKQGGWVADMKECPIKLSILSYYEGKQYAKKGQHLTSLSCELQNCKFDQK